MKNSQPFVTDRVRVERRTLEDVRKWAERYETTLTIALSLLIRRGLREEIADRMGREEADRIRREAEGIRLARETASARAKPLPLRPPVVDLDSPARRIPTPIPAQVVEGTGNHTLSNLATAVEILSQEIAELRKANSESGMRLATKTGTEK